MRRILPIALVIALLALTAGAKVIDMEGRKASLVGRIQLRLKKVGKTKDVGDISLDFATRTWTGTMEEGTLALSGTFQFVGKGGRKLDISYDAPSLAAVEEYFGEVAADLRLEKKGVDRDLTADIIYYKIIFRLSKSRKNARLKGKFRVEYTDPETDDEFRGTVKFRMKGVVSREDE
ncbi:MAG: hypothetical protein ABFS86_19315 [Planctomycetota bacterium]